MKLLTRFLGAMRAMEPRTPIEIVERDQPLYDTMGQAIESIVVYKPENRIALKLVIGWTILFQVDAETGAVEAPTYIEPTGDCSPAAVNNMLGRMEATLRETASDTGRL